MEAHSFYSTICFWWLSLGAVSEAALEEKPHFSTCLRRLKVSFVIIQKIVAKDIFSHLKQVEKWHFSTSARVHELDMLRIQAQLVRFHFLLE